MNATKKETDLIARLERIAAANPNLFKLEIEHDPGERLEIKVKFSDSHPLTYKRERLAAFVTVNVFSTLYTRSASARGSARFSVMRGDNLEKVTKVDFFRALAFEVESGNYHAERIAQESKESQKTQYDQTTLEESESGIIRVFGRNHGGTWEGIGSTSSKSEAVDIALDWGREFLPSVSEPETLTVDRNPDPKPAAAKLVKVAALISILREMAEFYEYEAGRMFHASPGDIAEFSRGSMSAQSAAAIAKAHPELFTYRRAHRKTCQGCLASRAAAGYYPARIGWTVTKGEQGN